LKASFWVSSSMAAAKYFWLAPVPVATDAFSEGFG
jgi:hypothetical protein